jgi:hypothetical protein
MAPNAVRVLARHHLVALVARWAARDRGAAADAAVQPASFCSASHSHGTDRPYGFGRLRFVPLQELLRTLADVLVVALARKRLLVPVQELRGRIRHACLSETPSSRGGIRRATAPSPEYGQSPYLAAPFSLSTPSGMAALNAEVTRQAAMVAYVDDFKLIMLIALASIPLLLL